VATEGLGPPELVGSGVVAGEAPDLGKMLDEKISQAKVGLARAAAGPRPKGVGELSQSLSEKSRFGSKPSGH
jgi:hypothetical protein